jgi:predicted ABC-type ATPase
MAQERIKRLRVFAGPNGSGKTSLFQYLLKIHAFNGYYHINPDEIAAGMAVGIDFNNWPVNFSAEEFFAFLDRSPFQKNAAFCFADTVELREKTISLKASPPGDASYLYAALGDFLRHKMFEADSSFSFETVFSHPSKVAELKTAKERGFITYLYVVATKDPGINLERVKNRVQRGGHNVPDDKVVERFGRTMENIATGFLLADRVYFFDNSASSATGAYQYFAEKRGDRLILTGNTVPAWFERTVLSKL